ncbi:GIY-YIG nuclease family protein [Faecalitalea cylindroides]|uniref:GIY-YIG nuclease family protein n=1 Tax=Faecalitalea cylindroides TaxID=39483 RepID=UPI00242C5BAD|nr:GIY-YIG nuclease family protein [Faecalitalea cylindroides]
MDEKTKKERLSKIFESDPLGLLTVDEPKTSPVSSQDSKLIDSFQEISDFYETNQRCPELGDDIGEYRLASRLIAIKKDPKKVKTLLPYDYYNLLESEDTKSVSVEELISDDPLGLLKGDDEADSIYTLSHVKPSERLRPDYIAHRTVCKDFELYKEAFKQIHDDLKHGRRRLVEFKESDLHEGCYYVLRGVVLYLEKNLAIKQKITYRSGAKVRREGRTRCIFDNGTESSMLYRSLGKALKLDGFCISDLIEQKEGSVSIDASDIQNGYIYVLRSLSRNPQIRSIQNLYKIGYCSGDVTERIKNAAHEPTYLMNDVEVILTVRCYNLDVLYLEQSIHSFFSNVNVCFEVLDDKGKKHYPKEWFTVPLNIIEEAIPLIVDKKIDSYRYDKNLQMIIQKSDSE